MCGIAGFSLGPNEQVNAKRLAKALLLDIESRGQDATGFAFIDSTGAFQVHKSDIDATAFVKRRLCIPRKATVAIMHTRFATQGLPTFNGNNHPIETGAIVGVHNGHISNDDAIFADIKDIVGGPVRIADVDSEAAFAALAWTGAPTLDVLEALRGSAALAWLDIENPSSIETLHLARVSSSPLIVCETEGGSVIFASTESAIRKACNATGMTPRMIRDIPEGTYLEVLHGDIHTVQSFKVPYSYSSYTRSYAWDDEYEWVNDTPPRGKRMYVVGPNGVVSSNKLDRRLAAETPEVWDKDDEYYEQWARENSAALDRAVGKDDAKDERFEEFYKQPWLHGGYLTDITLMVPKPSESEYLADDKNVEREYAVERWMNGLQCYSETAKTHAAGNLKAGVRPGDPVTTELNGARVQGHIVSVPQEFPDGHYFIRAYVYNDRRKSDYEPVFIVRKHYEFQLAFDNGFDHADAALAEDSARLSAIDR